MADDAVQLRPGLLANGLTIKEENFCLHYYRYGERLEAYVESYDVELTEEGKIPQWVQRAAYELLKKPHVRARVAELRKLVEVQTLVTADLMMEEAREAFELARKLGKPGNMVAATTLRAKLAGHLIEKREVTNKTERDMSDEELDRMINESAKEAGMVVTRVRDKTGEGSGSK